MLHVCLVWSFGLKYLFWSLRSWMEMVCQGTQCWDSNCCLPFGSMVGCYNATIISFTSQCESQLIGIKSIVTLVKRKIAVKSTVNCCVCVQYTTVYVCVPISLKNNCYHSIISIHYIFFSFIFHTNPGEDHHFTCPAPPIFKYTLSSHIHTNADFLIAPFKKIKVQECIIELVRSTTTGDPN